MGIAWIGVFLLLQNILCLSWIIHKEIFLSSTDLHNGPSYQMSLYLDMGSAPLTSTGTATGDTNRSCVEQEDKWLNNWEGAACGWQYQLSVQDKEREKRGRVVNWYIQGHDNFTASDGDTFMWILKQQDYYADAHCVLVDDGHKMSTDNERGIIFNRFVFQGTQVVWTAY